MFMYFDIETIPDMEKKDIFSEKYPDEGITWLQAEFWKIVCISCWYVQDDWLGIEFKLNSYCSNDEKKILEDFLEAIDNKAFDMLVWFNIISFDIPFVIKRALVHWLKIPKIMSTYDAQNWGCKKPRETRALDIMNIRKSTGNKNTSLDILCKTLWIQSPKQDHDWKDVFDLYEQWKFEEISKYCEWDVRACMDIYLKISLLI